MLGANFPHFRQLDRMDCGPTCLKIISAYYGGHHELDELRILCGVGVVGVSVGGLLEAFSAIQMEAMAIQVSFDELKKDLPLPCIVHWEQNHFMVVYKIKGDTVYVSNPAAGLMKYSSREFIEGWTYEDESKTGAVIIARPRADFKSTSSPLKVNSTFGFLVKYFQPYKKETYQILFGIVLGTIIQVSIPFLTQSIVDYGINFSNTNFILIILVAQLVLYLTQAGIEFIRGWILLHITSRINIEIISDFILILMGMPISYFDTKNTGDFVQRIRDHERVNTFLSRNSLLAATGILKIVVFSMILWFFDWKVFLIFLIGTGIYLGWTLSFLKKRAILDHLKFEQDTQNQTQIIQLIQGVEEIKFNASQNRRRATWYKTQIKLFHISLKSLSIEQSQMKGGGIINEVKNIFIVFFAALSVINGEMSLGAMLAVMYIIGSLNVPIKDIINFMLKYQDAKLSIARLIEVHRNDDQPTSVLYDDVPRFKKITFKDVSFKYPSSGPNLILSDINCSFEVGKTTAIVGSSGSGKTTLLKMLLMVYKPVEGGIYLDDKNINTISKDKWRRSCGTVLQDGFIFNDTLKNNITESGSLDPFDSKRYQRALEIANLNELIESLPGGGETIIYGSGGNLSGGERQRVLIARAVYKNPEYIFFDEATSSLDAKNEYQIMQKLEDFYKGKTVIVIAHRLSTIKNADKIIVIDKGKIVETGTNKELIKLNGYYHDLITQQL